MSTKERGYKEKKRRKRKNSGVVGGGGENVDQAILIAMCYFKDAVAAVVLFGGLWSCWIRLMCHKVTVPWCETESDWWQKGRYRYFVRQRSL